ncbi:mortality factor 4-like protein 1 [Penaeus japonicus]|uniref:mortality factor 4-like protein 1 n=1 Tax=Penaeus japonicus TaxID=27405 RepID=UPI001C712FE3|nr:mortality factor 4-like protein 1 [Penaeus japonicus]
MTSVEVRVKLPDELKPALVDDWDLINRQRKLPVVPARVTVDTILADYIKAKTSTKSITPNKESAVQEVVAGLREYFNVMLGTQLLYKFERPQYADILQEHKDKQASDIYGFIHLIRLFGKLIEKIGGSGVDFVEDFYVIIMPQHALCCTQSMPYEILKGSKSHATQCCRAPR